MANDAFQLQGLNGGVPIGAGETFTGMSRGLQVVEDAAFDYDLVNPLGTAATVTVASLAAGIFLGGPVSEIVVTSGIVVAFPASTDYTVS